MSHQDILYNVTGQSLELAVPEGQPSSVTSVSVYEMGQGDDGLAESATTGSAGVDSVSTTCDAASGRTQSNPRILNLASTTGIVAGRPYLVTGSGGEREWVDVVEISSGVSVTARYPLANDYVSGNAFVGTRISISLDSTWIADSNNLSPWWNGFPAYRVRWTYVVGGVTYVRDTTFDVVRYRGSHGVTVNDVDRLIPGWKNVLPQQYREDGGAALIDEARDQVTVDLRSAGIGDEQVRDPWMLDQLVKYRVVMMWARKRVYIDGADPQILAESRDEYQRVLGGLVTVTSAAKVPIATDTSGAGGRRSPTRLTVR